MWRPISRPDVKSYRAEEEDEHFINCAKGPIIILQGVNMGVVLQRLDKQRESIELKQLLSPGNVTRMLDHYRLLPLLAGQVFNLNADKCWRTASILNC